MSGTGGRGGGQLYGDHQPTSAGSVPSHDGDDACSVFFQSSACGVGGDAAPSYCSITDYLQGLLDPAELARHLEAPPADAESAVGDVIGQHGRQAGGGAPNPSMSSDPPRGKKGRPAPEEGGEEGEIDEEGSADHHNSRTDEKKQKMKGKAEKKARGSRVAFATKSEVDHLDDGYRWRKYGQKAVKNSSFPRSYYRCTAARCGVKKQVERSQQDPGTVVTTYEGQHVHPSPAAHRGGMPNGIHSLASLQQQRHGFSPSSPDDLLLAAASPAALLPRQPEQHLAEYYAMKLQDALLPDPLAGNQHGHR